ncbi:MAG: hypothetical protein ABII90_07850 [Bacteroidota bacterium]
MGNINSVDEIFDNNIILACDSGIIKADMDGNVLLTKFYPNPVKRIVQSFDSSYILITGLELLKIDTLFNLIDSLDLSTDFTLLSNLQIDTSGYWVFNTSKAGYIDNSFQLVSLLNFSNINGFYPSNYGLSYSQILLGGTAINLGNRCIALKSYDKSGATQNYSAKGIRLKEVIIFLQYQPKILLMVSIFTLYFQMNRFLRNIHPVNRETIFHIGKWQ